MGGDVGDLVLISALVVLRAGLVHVVEGRALLQALCSELGGCHVARGHCWPWQQFWYPPCPGPHHRPYHNDPLFPIARCRSTLAEPPRRGSGNNNNKDESKAGSGVHVVSILRSFDPFLVQSRVTPHTGARGDIVKFLMIPKYFIVCCGTEGPRCKVSPLGECALVAAYRHKSESTVTGNLGMTKDKRTYRTMMLFA